MRLHEPWWGFLGELERLLADPVTLHTTLEFALGMIAEARSA